MDKKDKYNTVGGYLFVIWLIFMVGVRLGMKHEDIAMAVVLVSTLLLVIYAIFTAGYDKGWQDNENA